MTMDKRLVTWLWFSNQDMPTTRPAMNASVFAKKLAKRLREAADELEGGKRLYISPAGNVADSMGTPFGYFETNDEAKRFTK
jgi:hypothetical protein